MQRYERIFYALDRRFGFAQDAEITVELDPATFDVEKVQNLVSLGVNRASVGIQSLNEDLLKICGRGHNAAEALRALEDIHKGGIHNVSADFISSIPGHSATQTQRQLCNDLRSVTACGVTHLSVYDL